MAKDNGNGTVTVVSGDTLYAIANKYNTTVSNLVELNKAEYESLATNPNLIKVGWVLRVTDSAPSGGSSEKPSNKMATNVDIGLMPQGDRSLLVTWSWDLGHTDHYDLIFYYSWGAGRALEEHVSTNDGQTTGKYYIYNAPEVATKVSVTVKPISETKKDSKGNESVYWTALWSTNNTDDPNCTSFFSFSEDAAPADTPSTPSVTIEDLGLTVEVDEVPDDVDLVEFQLNKNNETDFYETVEPRYNSASFLWSIDAGATYKARCRYINTNSSGEKHYTDWSSWSSVNKTQPYAPSGITACRAVSETEIYIAWGEVSNADSYDIQYAENREHLDSSDSTSNASNITSVDAPATSYTFVNIESGKTYYFQVRASNSHGKSAWTDVKSVTIGEPPAAPTTWSSTTTATLEDTVTLYWVHNSEDESTQDGFKVEIIVDDGSPKYYEKDTSEEDDDEKTTHYSFATSKYVGVKGGKLKWRVCTKGATGVYGEYSMYREIDVYAKPTLDLRVTNASGTSLSALTSFPFTITGIAGPDTQTPTGYHVSIVSNTYYQTIDDIGNAKVVNAGDTVYSHYFDTSSKLSTQISAGDVDLENNALYTVYVTVAMDSGLTAENFHDFLVAWTDEYYEPNAEIGVDKETLAIKLRPYCIDKNGTPISDTTLSVYRREFDGSFTEIAKGIDHTKGTFVTDPHPALDYARYRIVAITKSTGAVSYTDLPGYPIGEKAIIIQWNEAWNSYDTSDAPANSPSWSGSMLKLPYNIDTSEERKPDISLINYIGRKNPVSYYGTQIGETASWSVEIPKTDKETIYALRRLAIWMGDVYVREPSGVGYWANINVSFSIKHLATTIPVKLSITRVAGGM